MLRCCTRSHGNVTASTEMPSTTSTSTFCLVRHINEDANLLTAAPRAAYSAPISSSVLVIGGSRRHRHPDAGRGTDLCGAMGTARHASTKELCQHHVRPCKNGQNKTSSKPSSTPWPLRLRQVSMSNVNVFQWNEKSAFLRQILLLSFLDLMSIDEASRNTSEIIRRFHRILLLFCNLRFVVLFSWMITAVFFHSFGSLPHLIGCANF